MAPDSSGRPGSDRRNGTSGRRPTPILRGEPLRVEAEPVAVVGRARAVDLRRGVGEPVERSRQLPQGSGPERVDAALAGALGGDDAGALEGLEVLGRLWLARLGELGEDADRAGPLGQQADEPPAGRVGQCGEECVHGTSIRHGEYSCQGIS